MLEGRRRAHCDSLQLKQHAEICCSDAGSSRSGDADITLSVSLRSLLSPKPPLSAPSTWPLGDTILRAKSPSIMLGDCPNCCHRELQRRRKERMIEREWPPPPATERSHHQLRIWRHYVSRSGSSSREKSVFFKMLATCREQLPLSCPLRTSFALPRGAGCAPRNRGSHRNALRSYPRRPAGG